MLWPVINHNILIAWLFILFLISLSRYVMAFRYKATMPTPEKTYPWLRWFLVGSFISSLTWAACSVWLFPAGDLVPLGLHLGVHDPVAQGDPGSLDPRVEDPGGANGL